MGSVYRGTFSVPSKTAAVFLCPQTTKQKGRGHRMMSGKESCSQRTSNVPHVARNVWLSGKALRAAETHITKKSVPMSDIVSASRPRSARTAPANRSDRACGPLTTYRSGMGICRGGMTKRHFLSIASLRQSQEQRREKSEGRGGQLASGTKI